MEGSRRSLQSMASTLGVLLLSWLLAGIRSAAVLWVKIGERRFDYEKLSAEMDLRDLRANQALYKQDAKLAVALGYLETVGQRGVPPRKNPRATPPRYQTPYPNRIAASIYADRLMGELMKITGGPCRMEHDYKSGGIKFFDFQSGVCLNIAKEQLADEGSRAALFDKIARQVYEASHMKDLAQARCSGQPLGLLDIVTPS